MDIKMPPELGDSVLSVVKRLSDDKNDEIQIVMVAVATGRQPVVVSSIHPDQLGDIFAWLAAHQNESTYSTHSFDGKPN